jgi:RNA polymerase subunit RPABC4/transcription elongation factor Spt4
VAARYCSRCWIAYPPDHSTCDVCGTSPLTYDGFRNTDTNWEDLARIAVEVRDAQASDEATRIVFWRISRLCHMGLDTETSLAIAGRREGGAFVVDLGEFARILKKGATPAQAARILG